MKKVIICILLSGVSGVSGILFAQDNATQDTTYWTHSLKGILGINQSSFTNWQAGGENTIAWNTLLELNGNYNRDRTSWENRLKVGYGSINQKSTGFRKTDDVLSFRSKIGYRFVKDKPAWLTTASVSFLTQFADGFNYPNDSIKISAFLAPGYALIDLGIEFKKGGGDKFSALFSPLAMKLTIVNDDLLSAAGAFGVSPGENIRYELGTSFRLDYKDEIIKNVNYSGSLLLFTDYVENFGNVDVYFTNLFVFKINDVFAATLSFDFIYDDDVTIQEFDDSGNLTGEGPRLQYKQVLSLGLTLVLPREKDG